MPPVTSPRRANTASVQDVIPILKASFPAELNADFKYPQSIEKFISEFESLLRQLIAVTPRVTQNLIEQGLLNSFQDLDTAAARALAKQISGAAAHVFEKLKQTTSGKKLPDPLVRLIQIARQHFDRDRSRSVRNVKIQKNGFLAREKAVRTLKKKESDATAPATASVPPERMQEQAGADDPVDEIARLRALYKLPARGSASSRSFEISSDDDEIEMVEPAAGSTLTPVKSKPAAQMSPAHRRPRRACSSKSLQGPEHATSVPAVADKSMKPDPVNYVFMNAESGQLVRNVSGAEQVADEVKTGKKGFMQARFGSDWLDTMVANITYNMRQRTLQADKPEPAPEQRIRGKKAADKAAAKTKAAPKGKNKAKAKAKAKASVASGASGTGSEKVKAKAKTSAASGALGTGSEPGDDAGEPAEQAEVLDTSIPPCYRYMNYGGSRGIGLLKFVFMISGEKRRRKRHQYGSFRSKVATNDQMVEAADMTLHALDTGLVTEEGAEAYAKAELEKILLRDA